MKSETAEQKYDRLTRQLQGVILRAYPNPDRIDCPGDGAIEEVARRADITDKMEDHPAYGHIMHCSPCYAEFLEVRRRLTPPRDPAYKMPRRLEKDLRKRLDILETVMKDVARENGWRG
jgi:hypothetical protein